jgi:hypothetical protein
MRKYLNILAYSVFGTFMWSRCVPKFLELKKNDSENG